MYFNEDEIRDFILKKFGPFAASYYDINFPAGMIEFEGMNCDDCPGWNGISNRCDCGNRRVYWVWSSGILTAEAY